jgi:hypothetical protein
MKITRWMQLSQEQAGTTLVLNERSEIVACTTKRLATHFSGLVVSVVFPAPFGPAIINKNGCSKECAPDRDYATERRDLFFLPASSLRRGAAGPKSSSRPSG